MARMKDIVIKLQNGEELTPDEMAVVKESGVDVDSYKKNFGSESLYGSLFTGNPVGVSPVAYGTSDTVKKIAEKLGIEYKDIRQG